jgi:hypothetical protein
VTKCNIPACLHQQAFSGEAGSTTSPTDELSAIKWMKEMQSNKAWKDRPSSKMFMKLFRYISGVNKEREEVEMTVPVLNTKTPLEVSQNIPLPPPPSTHRTIQDPFMINLIWLRLSAVSSGACPFYDPADKADICIFSPSYSFTFECGLRAAELSLSTLSYNSFFFLVLNSI